MASGSRNSTFSTTINHQPSTIQRYQDERDTTNLAITSPILPGSGCHASVALNWSN
jgi:hypothetical protein